MLQICKDCLQSVDKETVKKIEMEAKRGKFSYSEMLSLCPICGCDLLYLPRWNKYDIR